MSLKNYEKFSLLFTTMIITSFSLLIFILLLTRTPLKNYSVYNGIVIKSGYLEVVIPDSDFKIFRNKGIIYIDNKKYRYEVYEIKKSIIKRNNKEYDSFILKYKMDKSLKENDIVSFSIFKNKLHLIEIFKVILESDNYETS